MSISLGQALEKMLKRFDLKDKYDENKTLDNWEELVGKTIGTHTTPQRIKKGKLYIKVDSPSWRNQLLFQKDYIKKRINEKMEKNIIREIILR
jgi:predicted nucleic acid-binding Zn ribbon protein